MTQIQQHIIDTQSQRWKKLNSEVAQYPSKSGQPITIVAATKYGDAEAAAGLILAGATIIGENRISDAENRLNQLSKFTLPPFSAHLIGSLQRNKIKRALTLFSCIQSMDRDSLFNDIQKECYAQNKCVDAMIQINTGSEDSKSGYSIAEVYSRHPQLFAFPNIKIIGIMAVTPFSEEPEEVRPLFKSAYRLFSELQPMYPNLVHLSMGMSKGYPVAIQEGATMIRIGSVLYGL